MTQSHWVAKFIHTMSTSGRWKETTFGLIQVLLGIHLFALFTYRGITDFLIRVEYEVDYLGEDPSERQDRG